MSSTPRPLGDGAARELLVAAFARLAASPSWTVTPRDDGWPLELAVRPGIQWSRMPGALSGDALATLVRDDRAYLYGWPYQASMLGYNRSPESIAAVVGDRWLQCDAVAFLRAGHDHDVREMLAKSVRPEDGDRVGVLTGSDRGEGSVTDLRLNEYVVRVLHGPDGPSLVGLGEVDRGLLAEISFDDRPLDLPDVQDRGVITVAEALVVFAARRPGRRRAQRGARPPDPVMQVLAPEDDTDQWVVRSDDLAGWAAASGLEVEERVRELVSARAPLLEPLLEFDSYPEAFLAYAGSEQAARDLAALCRAPDPA